MMLDKDPSDGDHAGPLPVGTDIPLASYNPQRQVRTTKTLVERSAVPSIDAHNHLGTWLSPKGSWMVPNVEDVIETMKLHNVRHIVNLDGRWGRELDSNLRRYDEAHPQLFSTFFQPDLTVLARPAAKASKALVGQLRESAARGAKGVKVWKTLGVEHRDEGGELVLPDSPLVQPFFEAAGEFGLPVTIHTADPIAFFRPLDRFNERLENLSEFPEWWYGAPGFPTFDQLIDSLESLVASNPGTTFVGAHVGCFAEDLARVSSMLSSYPNYNVDLGARMAELGRQPRRTRELILSHPTQVLFGTDEYPVSGENYARWFRFLETDDECFSYSTDGGIPPMGRWDISAIDLPTESLELLYAGNAARILRLPPATAAQRG